MQISTHQIPAGPQIRVVTISEEEFAQGVEDKRQRRLSNVSNNLTAPALTPHN